MITDFLTNNETSARSILEVRAKPEEHILRRTIYVLLTHGLRNEM
jgi:hypothetical protein